MDHVEAREILELAAVEPAGLARLTAGDTPEAAALAGHLAGCEECTAEMARLRRVAGIVRTVVRTTPPPELRERTLAFVRALGRDRSAVAATAGASAGAAAVVAPAVPTPRKRTGPSRLSLGRLAAVAAVVALAVAGTGLVVQSRALAERDATIRSQAEAVADLATVTSWTLRVAAMPDARRVELASAAAADKHGSVIFSPSTHELVVVATGLVEPGGEREFRCWLDTGGTRETVGRMFFGGGISYWVGPVDAVAGLRDGARFGVSLVDRSAPAVRTEPVLTGEL